MTDENETITFTGTVSLSDVAAVERAVAEGRPIKLKGVIELPDSVASTLGEILNADTNDMVELLKIGGIDPAAGLTYSDMTDIDWGDSNLDGYNFEGADLSRSNFSRAKIDLMTYGGATITDVIWPEGYTADNGINS
jgi:hypothetical protein